MWIIRFSINNPVTVIVGIILIVIFGGLTLSKIPVQLKPTVDKPEIKISTAYSGAAPQEVEEQITIPIEEKLQAVEGLRRITSSSREGASTIELEFEWGVNKDIAVIDIIKRLSRVKEFPEEADEPVIFAGTSSERQSIYWANLRGRMPVNRLRVLADDFIVPRFERIEGVGEIRVYGGEEREIQVVVDFRALSARGLGVRDLLAALRLENMNVRGGHIDQGKRRYLVRTVGLFKGIGDIEALIVKKDSQGGPVYLRDVANVYDTFKKRSSMVKIMGEPAVAFGIVKKSDANTIAVISKLESVIEQLNEELAPQGVSVRESYDSSDYIWESIQFVTYNFAFGALLAVIALILFLKSFRSTLVIGLAIPIVAFSGFILLGLFGRSINIISLAGMAFAVGMVVDNAIVVLENIYRHLQMGKGKAQAALEGTEEVWGAILASTLTTLAVFIPIIFVKEEAGQLFRDIAIAISCSVLVSLIVSITVIPMLSARILGVGALFSGSFGGGALKMLMIDKLGGYISHIFISITEKLSVSSTKLKLAVAAVIVLAALSVAAIIPKMEYLPKGNRNMIFTTFKSFVGSNIEASQKYSDAIAEKILNVPEVRYIFHVVSSRFNGIGARVKDEYRLEIARVAQKINKEIGGAPGFEYARAFQIPLFSRFSGSDMEIEIRGLEFGKIKAISNEIRGKLMGVEGVEFVRSSQESGGPEYQVYIDRERAADLNLSVSDISEVVETLVAGKKATLYKIGGEEIDITVKGEEGAFVNRHSLENIMIYGANGIAVQLDSLAKIVETTGPTRINHIEMDRAETLMVTKAQETPLQTMVEGVNETILKPIRQKLDIGYSISLSGSASDLEATAKALSGSFILAIVIVYLLMAALFESFLYPLIIMFAVPLAASGAMVAVVGMGVPLDVLTVLGFIILAGIVVNNAILLVHQSIRNNTEHGMPKKEAMIEAVKTRIRPIFMSTITTVFGMLPLMVRGGAGSELYSGLATAIVGGLTVSTIFTLVLVPAVYLIVNDLISKGDQTT